MLGDLQRPKVVHFFWLIGCLSTNVNITAMLTVISIFRNDIEACNYRQPFPSGSNLPCYVTMHHT